MHQPTLRGPSRSLALLLACAACAGGGCLKTAVTSWTRTEGTPLGVGGEPLTEHGEILASTDARGAAVPAVTLMQRGRVVWTERQTEDCERQALDALGRSERWRDAMKLASQVAVLAVDGLWPVTAYLVSTRPAVVVVVPMRHPKRVKLAREALGPDPRAAQGLIGQFTYAQSRVPDADFAAIFLPESGIGPIALERSQSIEFPVAGGGIALRARDKGWQATWMPPGELSREAAKLLEIYEQR